MCKNSGKINQNTVPTEHFSQVRQETKNNGKLDVFQS